MTELDRLFTIAERAAVSVYSRWPDAIPWDNWDWDDARQAAAEGVVRALHSKDAITDGYLYVSARRSVMRWLWRERVGRSVQSSKQLHDGIREPMNDADTQALLSDAQREYLRKMLAQRKRNGELEAETDLAILELLCDGVPPTRIAERLNLTPRALRARRARLRERLRRMNGGQYEDV